MLKVSDKRKSGIYIYWIIVALICGALLSIQTVFAATETVWDRFETILNDFYGKLLGISTIVAVVSATVALIIRMVSKNQKVVDEATAWIKRIVITWFLINTVGLIVAYVEPLVAGGRYGA